MAHPFRWKWQRWQQQKRRRSTYFRRARQGLPSPAGFSGPALSTDEAGPGTTESGQSLNFLQRILDALDMTAEQAASRFAFALGDLQQMRHGTRGQIAAVDQDEIWVVFADYIDARMGQMVSVREELQRKMSTERKKRLVNRMRIARR
jgi:hypothetical protein